MCSCLEHIEEAMDHYLDDYGNLPILVESEIDQVCNFCNKLAIYKIIEGVMMEESE